MYSLCWRRLSATCLGVCSIQTVQEGGLPLSNESTWCTPIARQIIFLTKFLPTSGCTIPNSGHRGHDIRAGHIAHPLQCAKDCDANPTCVGSTWDTNNKCWLHHKMEKARLYHAGKYVLYVKNCTPPKVEPPKVEPPNLVKKREYGNRSKIVSLFVHCSIDVLIHRLQFHFLLKLWLRRSKRVLR